jgi:acetoacetyl-CoA synthetase
MNSADPQAAQRATGSQTTRLASLVTMKPGRSGPALFVIPGFGGSLGRLLDLATNLDTPLPVIGLQGRGSDGTSQADNDVGSMADEYLALILAAQPSGPYLLLGHSFGGLVAIEIALRLLRTGRSIACLILLDSNYAGRFWPRSYYLQDVRNRIRRRAGELMATPAGQKGAYLSEALVKLRRRLRGGAPDDALAYDAMASHELAFNRYAPAFYPGKLIFFRASLKDYPADPDALWRGRAREVEVYSAEGGHLTMLDPPHVLPLAAAISVQLAAHAQA